MKKLVAYVVIFHDKHGGHTAFLETVHNGKHISYKSPRYASADNCKHTVVCWFNDNLTTHYPSFVDQHEQ